MIHAESLSALSAELQRARAKFPGNRHLTVALMEEVGELAQAQLQRQGRDRVRKEALQVACVAMRIYEEGDATMADVTDEESKP
jgi:NTP pyrophosphatase (non-canonical NTP hydrolase)